MEYNNFYLVFEGDFTNDLRLDIRQSRNLKQNTHFTQDNIDGHTNNMVQEP